MAQQNEQIDFTHIGQESTQLIQDFVAQQQETANNLAPILKNLTEVSINMLQDPQKLMQMQIDLYQSYLGLWSQMAEKATGQKISTTPLQPKKGDRRFQHEDWQENMVFDFIKQSYLLTANWVNESLSNVEGMNEHDHKKAIFQINQFLDAISPSNFPITNPEVIKATIESNGQNLVNGLKNILTDMEHGSISMTDYKAFEVGKNIAVTKGKVVYQNRLIQLIQYSPTTKEVSKTPLVIFPPWINRFYILDLQEKNSFVKYAVNAGQTVFMVSWKNPDESYANVGWEDYLNEGIFEAIAQALEITGEKSLNTIGYCIGGTLLSSALAVMAKTNDNRVNSATFFTSLMDFENPGEIEVFLDEEQISALEEKMAKKGYLEGRDMASAFSALRSNDLVWSFVVNNYLLGKDPFPFDLLYWNDDPTRMPAKMHSYYLRNMYLENNLAKKDKLTLCGQKIDITKINMPMYMVTGLNDHITPWKSCYAPFQRMQSKNKRFILGKAGHVAGVANPPVPKGKPMKKAFWSGEATQKNPETWLKSAKENKDSWWADWASWCNDVSGEKIPARTKLGSTKNKPLEDAPGSYVKQRY